MAVSAKASIEGHQILEAIDGQPRLPRAHRRLFPTENPEQELKNFLGDAEVKKIFQEWMYSTDPSAV